MNKKIFLIVLFLSGFYFLRADQILAEDDDFAQALDNIKNPFDDGYPKPVAVVVVPKPVYHPPPRVIPRPRPMPIIRPRIIFERVTFPQLNLSGVVVGEDIHWAILNDTIVPLNGVIKGARVSRISKEGVELTYKGKKMFLKVD